MLSRVADSVHWMSRYVERAENLARFVHVNLNLMLDAPPGVPPQWEPLISTTGDNAAFVERYAGPSQENVIQFLTFDDQNPNSILSCWRRPRERPLSPRDHFLRDVGTTQHRVPLCAGRREPGAAAGQTPGVLHSRATPSTSNRRNNF